MKRTARAQISMLDEIIVDNFAGGGGASTGIELAMWPKYRDNYIPPTIIPADGEAADNA